jgi:UDP-N-acetylmuramyl pentapeptide phosphotransferase/UDP-N-acetylglucosamine-1-phosphate transferase
MKIAAEWFSPVRMGGMAVYIVAAASCVLAWVHCRRDEHDSRLALVLGLVNTALLVDLAFDLRWQMYNLLRSRAMTHQWYNQRHGPQVIALTLLAMVLLATLAAAWRSFHSTPGAVPAIGGTLLAGSTWCTEVISLHSTDSILFHHAGPFMTINFLWLAAAAMTTAGMRKLSGRRPRL